MIELKIDNNIKNKKGKIWPASANAMDKDVRNTRRMRVYWKTTLVQQTLLS